MSYSLFERLSVALADLLQTLVKLRQQTPRPVLSHSPPPATKHGKITIPAKNVYNLAGRLLSCVLAIYWISDCNRVFSPSGFILFKKQKHMYEFIEQIMFWLL